MFPASFIPKAHLILAVLFLFCGCGRHPQTVPTTISHDTAQASHSQIDTFNIDSPTEATMRTMGLVDIQEIDSTIHVSLMYATADNFMKKVLYPDIRKAFVLPELAEKLANAQKQLQAIHPGYSLIIYDAARPLHVQREMWETAQTMGMTKYVANPLKRNGLHNYAAAVDISIVDENGTPLSMGTPIDWFGPESHTTDEAQLVADGKITEQELANRMLLRKIMKSNGMLTIRSEWWHFEMMRAKQAKATLKIIE